VTNTSTLRRAAAIAYLIAAIVILIRGGDSSEPWLLVAGVLFVLWISSPVAFGLWSARFIRGSIHFVYLAVCIIVGVAGFGVQWHVMFIGPSDAQNGLILIFIPLYQWTAIIIAFAIARLLARYVFES
jgi:hypothetical protein